MTLFLDEAKRYRKKLQRKIFIALDGMEQNALLIAQEAGIQIWDLDSFNRLLRLYDQPQMILLPERAEHGTPLGTVAQGVYSA